MDIQPFTEGDYFHIYNRGVNSENLFKEERNYYYFLNQYQLYCSDVLETYAYCLLKNHFHIVVYVKKNAEVPRKNGDGIFRMNASKQLSHFFNSYTQSINKAYNRTGPLFESPFERKLIDNDYYLRKVICYCHQNPQLHGFVSDFKEWEFSSYRAFLKDNNSLVVSEKILNLFTGVKNFEEAHKINDYNDRDSNNYIIEKK